MIKIDRVEMTDGTVYRNLYYGSDWEDLSFYSESNVPSILFYYRKGQEFKELELKTEEITDIALGDGDAQSEYLLYHDEQSGHTLLSKDLEDDFMFEGDMPYDPRLEPISCFIEDLMSNLMDKYEDISYGDGFMIVDNIVATVLGYLETVLDLNDHNLSDEDIMIKGTTVSVLAVIFAGEQLESADGRKSLLKDIYSIVADFTKFVEENHDRVTCVKIDEDTLK